METNQDGRGERRCPFHRDESNETPAPDSSDLLKEALVYTEEDGGRRCIFDSHVALNHSCYGGLVPEEDVVDKRKAGILYQVPAGKLWPSQTDEPVKPLAQTAHDMFRAHVLGPHYPCVGARAALKQSTYRFGFYKDMAHLGSVSAMGRDLRRFVHEYEQLGNFATFIAGFHRPQSTTPDEFEQLLWKHLQMLHEHDTEDWDPHYSPDPTSKNFAFSFMGCAFFVVGQHSGAERYSRIAPFPMLIFNPESQIRRLREQGGLEAFAAKVRERDIEYQGTTNPLLPEDKNNTGGEAVVYASNYRHVGRKFKVPFTPRRDVLDAHRRRQAK